MKRIILAISVLLVFGLAVLGVAYNQNAAAETAMASCCCNSGDACPMKKNAAGTETASCCDDGCCKDGSCPMKGSAGAATDAKHPENCPMMKDKQGHEGHAMMMKDGKHEGSCCCPCCAAKHAA